MGHFPCPVIPPLEAALIKFSWYEPSHHQHLCMGSYSWKIVLLGTQPQVDSIYSQYYENIIALFSGFTTTVEVSAISLIVVPL